MIEFTTKVIRMGKDLGVIISDEIVKKEGLKEGDKLVCIIKRIKE